jgi:hypothetical protein
LAISAPKRVISPSSLQEEPVVFNNGTANVPLFFRGRANIDGIVDAVSRNVMGSPNLLKNARNVVETGCSAGGLATYLHADYVRDLVPHSGVYLSMPISGYFLNHQTVEGEYVCESRRRIGSWPSIREPAVLSPACVSCRSTV